MNVRPRAVIVDIDGTLADATHRLHLIKPPKKNWDAFYDACHRDVPVAHVCALVNLLKPAYNILLVTGRVERVRAKTMDWMTGYWVAWDRLFMRPDGDYREDQVLKEEILDRDILPHYRPEFAIDDRTRVVQMWRRRGIPCLQVAEGDF